MMTDEEITWAYRILLCRDPESQKAIDSHRMHSSIAAMIDAFLVSKEFQNRKTGPIHVGCNLSSSMLKVEVDASEVLLQKMLDRISSEWVSFGAKDPFWSVLTQPQFHSERMESREDFYASGRDFVDTLIATLTRNDVDLSKIHDVLDYGCGVGRITFALAERFKNCTGIDVSDSHMQYGRDRSERLNNVAFRKLSNLRELNDIGTYDLIVSVIVLQHNPPPIIKYILTNLLRSLKIGGVALFQVPTFKERYKFEISEYLNNDAYGMEMHILPQKEIYRILYDNGCELLEVREDNATGYKDGVSQRFVVRHVRTGQSI